MQEGIHKTEAGKFELPLPVKNRAPKLPNNRGVAEKRLAALKRKLSADSKYHQDYSNFMEEIITEGYAEPVGDGIGKPEDDEQHWFLPHHGVYHPQKPNKIRVVFDCSSECQGLSLNDILLQGPDFTNSLHGILCRFRREPVAFCCDIRAMFNQVSVNKEHRNFLRFLWWEGGRLDQAPKVFRMTTHLFGAKSSPACAMYALRCVAESCSEEVADFIQHDFYVDDGLTSTKDEESALKLIYNVRSACAANGFHLLKFASNSKGILEKLQTDEASPAIKLEL